MSTRAHLSLSLLAVFAAPHASASSVWGSLDTSRLESTGDGLSSSSTLTDLRSEITADGGSLASPATTIDATYLSGIDVFFASMMSSAPTPAELTALSDFVQNGGVCIVTCDDGNRVASNGVFSQLASTSTPRGGQRRRLRVRRTLARHRRRYDLVHGQRQPRHDRRHGHLAARERRRLGARKSRLRHERVVRQLRFRATPRCAA